MTSFLRGAPPLKKYPGSALVYLSEESTLSLSKIACKHYYKLFNEGPVSEPSWNQKNGEKTSETAFSTGEAILPRYFGVLKITSLGNFISNISQDNYYQKKNLTNFILQPTTIAISVLRQIL